MPLNKPQLLVLNQVNFPDNTQQLITPVLLRDFNTQMINSMELTQSMDAYANLGTANLFYGGNQSIAKEYKLVANGVYWNDSTVGYNNLEIINSATGNLDLAALNGGVRIVSSSLNITNGTFTASLAEGFTYVGNGSGRTTLVSTSSFGSSINTGSFATTGSNTFVGNQSISGAIYQSGTFYADQIDVSQGGIYQMTGSYIATFSSSGLLTYDTYTNVASALQPYLQTGSSIPVGTISGSQQITDLGFVSSSVTASSLITASFNGNTLTFTKGDSSTFGVVIPDVSGSTIPSGTISGSSQITALGFVSSSVTASSLVTASFSGNTLTFTKGDTSTFGVVIPDVSGSTINTGSFATTGSNTFIGDETFQDGSGNASTLSPYSGSIVLVAKGLTSGSAGLSHLSASANNVNLIFKTSNANNGTTTISGSGNILVSPAAPTAGFKRLAGNLNIFLTTVVPEMTGSLTFTPTINSNYANSVIRFRGPASSSAWTFNNNIVNGNFNVGNADATSANQAIAGGSMNSNVLLAAINYNAYTTPLVASANFQSNLAVGNATLTSFSSSIQATNNIFNGNTFTVNNSYFGTASTAAAQRLGLSFNVLGGVNTPTLTASGSNTIAAAPREVIGNTTNGSGVAIGVVLNGDNSNLYSTLIHGSNLTVTGSSAYNTYATAGSTFIGRNNSVNGTAARSAETIFAVGTGTGTGARKTGFLIDSGSNTFIEGTLNVSGSTSFNGAVNITGSLTSSLTLGYVLVGGAGNVSTLVATSSFAGGSVPAGTISGSSQITALGFVSSSVTASSLVTASVNLNTITFTKGDASTFAITVDTGSGGGSVPVGTVSSSAQILGYNIFATTGSNTFTGGQTINSGGGLTLAPNVGGGGTDNFINIKNENQQTMFLQNTVVSSGYQSGSILQLSAGSGSNGYGFSGSATFQMDALYNGYKSAIKVQAINGVGSSLIGLGERISFGAKEGFPYTPSNTFTVDATSIELSGSLKLNTGTSGPAGTAVLDGANPGTVTVSNSLVSSNSLIFLTKQTLTNAHMVAVSSKGSGTFTITSNGNGDSDTVAYLIINPIP